MIQIHQASLLLMTNLIKQIYILICKSIICSFINKEELSISCCDIYIYVRNLREIIIFFIVNHYLNILLCIKINILIITRFFV